MERDEWGEFLKILDAVSDLYGKDKMVGPGVSMFFGLMAPYSFQEFSRAMEEHCRTCKFFPRPADLIGIIEGSAEDRGRLAWQEVLRACEVHGTYRSVNFDDPRIHYAVNAIGGWVKFGAMPESERPFREKDFLLHFRAAERMRLTWESIGVPRRLVGHCEQENAFHGHEVEPPVLASAPPPKLRPAEEPSRIEARPKADHPIGVDAMISGVAASVRIG